MGIRAYLDWNATAPLRSEAREAMTAAIDVVGNPSSVHAEGRAARRVVEEAREHIAALVGAIPRNVIFTSGGTEANALALMPGWHHGELSAPDRLLMSTIEHPSVRSGGRFPLSAQENIPVTGAGVADREWLGHRLAELGDSKPLVSLMLANNETGVIQPIAAVAEAVHARGGLVHVDAVQAAGKIFFDINSLRADLLTVSAHKLGGPKGIGALILANEALYIPDPVLKGGGQESARRAGTENVIGIAGFGAAAQAARQSLTDDAARMATARDHLETRLRDIASETVIFGADTPRLPNTTLLAMPGIRAETALIALDLDGVAVSSGSACSSGKVAPSHVLAAMGVRPELALGAIRVSLGPSTTDDEIEMFLKAWTKRVMGLSRGKRGLAA
jgi:cysteine desulfurase